MVVTTQLATLQNRTAEIANATTVLNTIGKIPTNLPQIPYIIPYAVELKEIMDDIITMLTWAIDIDGVIGNDVFYNSIFTEEGVNRSITLTRLQAIHSFITIKPNFGAVVNDLGSYPEVSNAVFAKIIENIKSEVNASFDETNNPNVLQYKTAIQNTFNVIFTKSSDPHTDNGNTFLADDWVFVSLHFVQQALTATAFALRDWIYTQSTEHYVNPYDLFARVMGQTEFRNISEISDIAFAIAQQRQQGAQINVYRRIDANSSPVTSRQLYMTPNNVIHELGHAFDGRAGFGFKTLGSIEDSIQNSDTQGPITDGTFDRSGMYKGLDYLKESFHVHATITDTDGDGTYERAIIDLPADGTSEYTALVPSQYLFYDVAETEYAIWQHSGYESRYGFNLRIDTLVQNPTESDTEATADAFLNWVRNGFTNTTDGIAWKTFFDANMGMFLRNAIIYTSPGGMLQYYIDRGDVPSVPIASFAKGTGTPVRVRLSPDDSNNILYESDSANLSDPVKVYGLIQETLTPISNYWVMSVDNQNRLVWFASEAVVATSTELSVLYNNDFDDSLISPVRSVDTIDVNLIRGD